MMHIEMKRTFNPVGEGSFCVERFTVGEEEHSFVFDCGSSTLLDMGEGTSSLVSREIDTGFDGGEAVDAVFISHYDREHMNGLEELLLKHPVEKLFLPLPESASRLFLSLKSKIEFSNASGSFVQLLINHPWELLKDKRYHVKEIVYVEELAWEESDIERNVLDFEEVSGKIPSGTLIQCRFGTNMVLWKFVLVNFREENRIERLRKECLKKKLPLPKNMQDVEVLWERHYRDVIKLFLGELLEDFSTNALVVYSGKMTDRFGIEMHPVQAGESFGKCRSYFRIRSGCMYLGDFSLEKRLQWYRLQHIYEDEWAQISVWLLPHHGCAKYFRHEATVHDAELYIACAGTSNTFRHPSRTIIRKLELVGKKMYWVNEKTENRVVFSYTFFPADE